MDTHSHYTKMPDKQTWLMIKPHQHIMLDDDRASLDSQIFKKPFEIVDSKGVAFAKERIENEGESVETLKYLAEKLNKQLRYRESIECYKKALALDPGSKELKILLAGRYLTTCQTAEALDIYLGIRYDKSEYMITYRIGLCFFYLGQYEKAKKYFLEGIGLTGDDPDMYIAFLYWYLLCFVELGEDIKPALDLYRELFVIHHAGYEYAIRIFLGDDPWDYEENSQHDNLTRIMYLFGLYEYYVWKKDEKLAAQTFEECIRCDEYWASYSGIAVWTKKMLQNSNETAKAHGHVHDPKEKRRQINRLSRIIGHLEYVKKMMEADEDCSDVLMQISASKSALNGLGKAIINDHMTHCIVHAIEDGDTKAVEEFQKAIEKYL